MATVDLEPAARRMAGLLTDVSDDMLGLPTPSDWSLGDLLDHIGGFSLAFTAAARKDVGATTAQAPSADASRLGTDWRTRIPRDLATLAQAWRDPQAWTGMTEAGGVDLPGEVAGVIALDELVVHGWDVARATGQEYECDESSLTAVHGFVSQFAGPGHEEERAGLFGPEVEVPAGAPLLDRILGITGRDPAWTNEA